MREIKTWGDNLKVVIDLHTHSISSGHAYSSVQEIAIEAYRNGMKMFALTDHGPELIGAPTLYHFGNLKIIPNELYGVRVIKGVEANILDKSGNIDIPDYLLGRLDYVIASLHDACIEYSTIEENTKAVINAMKNPYVDTIGHPGNPKYQVDINKVVEAAKEYGKFIEINEGTFFVRRGSEENCMNFAIACKKLGVGIACGSDSHFSFSVGKFDNVYKLLNEAGIPEELVLNTSVEKFEKHLKSKRERMNSI